MCCGSVTIPSVFPGRTSMPRRLPARPSPRRRAVRVRQPSRITEGRCQRIPSFAISTCARSSICDRISSRRGSPLAWRRSASRAAMACRSAVATPSRQKRRLERGRGRRGVRGRAARTGACARRHRPLPAGRGARPWWRAARADARGRARGIAGRRERWPAGRAAARRAAAGAARIVDSHRGRGDSLAIGSRDRTRR